MLESLTIKNYAIIDEVTVGFAEGLTAITGETGAGKSIVVDAFELVLGARASTDLIRSGAEALTVHGVFRIDGVDLPADILPDLSEGVAIVRREVRSDGSSRCHLNDNPVTLRTLKQLGEHLADLHGQHDHQSLLNPSLHLNYLDRYGGITSLADDVASIYDEYRNITAMIDRIEASMTSFARDRELFRFQIEEIEGIAPLPGEDSSLDEAIRRGARATELKALGWEVFQTLAEDENSLMERLGTLATRTDHLSRHDEALNPLLERLEELSIAMTDSANQFRAYADGIDDDPASLAAMEERLGIIERLKKKYGPSLEDVFTHLASIRETVERAETSTVELDDLRNHRIVLARRLRESASLLSAARRKTAPRFSAAVEEQFLQLGMSGATLPVAFEPVSGPVVLPEDCGGGAFSREGCDRLEFLFSANRGEQPRPLAKVASGGELSRVMLSLKLVLAGVAGVPTMVFDEIDTGVSGRIADAMGRMMLELSRTRQVVVITHLPQIAAMADRHFSARKNTRGDRTVTELVFLSEAERSDELASLLSGETLADTARAHAQELLDAAAQRRAILDAATVR